MFRISQRRSTRRQINSSGNVRRGSAAVECAFCIPVVIILMFGTLETCSGLYLKESLTVAAFEGARVGVRRRATNADVIARCTEVLGERGIVDAIITVTPDDFSRLNALDTITVTVAAPTANNSLYVFDFAADRDASARVSMVREFDD